MTRGVVVGCVLAVGLLLGLPDAASACSCVGMPPCQALWLNRDSGPNVFEATVESVELVRNEYPLVNGVRRVDAGTIVARLKDVKALLGTSATVVTTSGLGASCGFSFKVGERYVIEAVASADGLTTSSCSQTKPVAQAGPLLDYIALLSRPSPGATVTGAVSASMRYPFQDPRQPRGLADLTVTIDGPVRRTTQAGVDGSFAFAALPAGHYRIGVDASAAGPYRAAPTREFELPNAYACHSAYVPVTLDATIDGTVVDAAGKPVPGASVALRRTDALTTKDRDPLGIPGRVDYATARTDALGHYQFEGVPPGQYVAGLNIDAGPTRESPYRPVFITGPDGQPEVIDFPLGGHRTLSPVMALDTSPVTVVGQVRWPDGRPGTGMRVRAFAHGETPLRIGLASDALADTNGRFTLTLPGGIAHSVRAFAEPGSRTPETAGLSAEAEVIAAPGLSVTLVLGRRR